VKKSAHCSRAEEDPICAADLVKGRATAHVPATQLARRLRVIQEAKEQFWDR
jgi:hypothetical protein